MDQPFDPNSALSRNAELELVQNLWNRDANEATLANYRSYLDYYVKEVRNLLFGSRWVLKNSAAQTHRQLLNIVQILSDQRDLDLPKMTQKVKEQPEFSGAPDECIQRSIDMALRVWLTLNVRETELDSLTPDTECLQWDGGVTLKTFVAGLFLNSSPSSKVDDGLESRFTVADMCHSNGLRVEWTKCLADHLRVDLDNRKVRIYYLKQCLYDHMKGRGRVLGKNGSILPDKLLEETIWTLNLLFPPNKQTTINFLNNQKSPKTFYNEEPYEETRHLNLNDYPHWRQRLEDLRTISRNPPDKIRQYWHQQNRGERLKLILTVVAGFILALIFGIISSTTALISMRISLDALEVSRSALARQMEAPICPCSS